MKIKKITIENFRSIENETFNIEEIHGGKTYTLIGINESGKSSFLRAVSLVDGGDVLFPKDYFNESKPISVLLTYNLEIS
jgi:predicted ATP-dependent endonuclease of OLD family